MGCGGGDNIWLLDKEFNCRNVYAIDFSQPSVDFVNRFFPWVKATRACVSEVPYSDNQFDIVTMLDITEHLPPLLYLFSLFSCYRVLKPGGRTAVLPGMTDLPEHINVLPLSTIKDHMERIGFSIKNGTDKWIIGRKPNPNQLSDDFIKFKFPME